MMLENMWKFLVVMNLIGSLVTVNILAICGWGTVLVLMLERESMKEEKE